MLGTLLANGIPLLASMRISREAAGNPLLTDAIDAAAEAVGGGESLAKPLEQSGLFGEEVVEMISVGESGVEGGGYQLCERLVAATVKRSRDDNGSI